MRTPAMLTVTQLNTYIKSMLDGDPNLASVFVSGEISNFTNHYRSGHFYLSLKDEKCVIKSVMFAQYARRIRFQPQDGMKVIVRGHVSVYEPSGQYQLYIEDMQPDGVGALNLAYEQLKEKLGAEGLFSVERKKPLPPFPTHVGVITSPTGAAVHDILTILERRWPLAEVVFCPVLVQGDGAAPQLVEALQRMNRQHCADVIILGRGGGSLEDLWPFNEESLARAVASSEIPVISAVGHETDFTICDFAADLRAPTPSAAAELAVPDSAELMLNVQAQQARMKSLLSGKIQTLYQQLNALSSSRVMRMPQEQLSLRRMQVDTLASRMQNSMKQKLVQANQQLAESSGKLHALSPLAVLARGYAIASDGAGKTVSRVASVREGETLFLRLTDGNLSCIVEQIKKTSGTAKEETTDGHGKSDV